MALAAVAIGFQVAGKRKAAKGARRVAGAQDAARKLSEARERASTIRAASQAMGQQAVAAAGQGVDESSSAQTGFSSLLNQMQSNLTFINRNSLLAEKVKAANQVIRRGQAIAQVGDYINQFAGSMS